MSSSTTQSPSPSLTEKAIQSGKYGRYYDPVLPQSPTMQKIVAEACSMNGGTAAVMLQIASKGVGLGVAAHSSFTLRPVQRARRSIVYIYAMAFGTEAERRIVTDATHAAHTHVKGPGYDADDVELQLWVAATTYWGLLTGYEEVYGKLDDKKADQAYKEFSVVATGLRVPPEKWPKDRKAFQEYWDKTINELEITPEAKGVAQDVLYPKRKNLSSWLWIYTLMTGEPIRVLTIELLPERIRNKFDIPSTQYTRIVYRLMRGLNRIFYPLLPDVAHHGVKNYYMSDFRQRLAKGSKL